MKVVATEIELRSTMKKDISGMVEACVPSNLRIGKDILANGDVVLESLGENEVRAIIHGNLERRVEFRSSSDEFQWKCTCRRDQKRFCKHAAALGLWLLKNEKREAE
jgi:uncharacterized Zn finger protein